jgi:hypothetical protein
MFRVFQMFQKYVASVSDGCCIFCNGLLPMLSSVFSKRMLQMCLSGCCICFTHTLHMFYLDVTYVCTGFQVSRLPSDVCCNCCIWMFQKQIGFTSLLLAFCCIVSMCSLGADKAYVQRYGWALQIEGTAPFPSCRSGGAGPRGERETECGARASVLTSRR